MANPQQQQENRQRVEKALQQIRNKPAAPEIDFTIHTTEDGTQVSTQERVIKDVQAPAFHKPTDEEFFSSKDPTKPDIAFLKNHFYREGRLTEAQALFILRSATEILRQEPNLLEVDAPITGEDSCTAISNALARAHKMASFYSPVCGDIHGQYVSTLPALSTLASALTRVFPPSLTS